MPVSRKALESQLSHFDAGKRRDALLTLIDMAEHRRIRFPEPRDRVNLHCHTFFSYNGYGYSPTYFAWKARREGLRVAGVVDFDVLDAADEFLDACATLGLRGCAGLETRVFVPEFSSREINSPGEPGISYHMGAGFTSGTVENAELLGSFKAIAQARTQGVASRVNAYLGRAAVDYKRDVLPLTPMGNATERHLCMAYDTKAREVFPNEDERAVFWAGKLGTSPDKIKPILDNGPALQSLIRAKTMKAGGVGYVKAAASDFPSADSVNAFVLANGAVPVLTWLDGLSEGERAIEELLDVMKAGGVAAVNIIPDRNWNIKDPGLKKKKVDRLHAFARLAESRGLPIVVGTEMNAPGQRFVDDFDAPELAPLVPLFLEGAHIMYAHTLLQAKAGMGYLSDWAKENFDTVEDKNAFFKRVGETVEPGAAAGLDSVTPDMAPRDIALD